MSLIGKTVEEQMWNFFMARVGNAYGVAALMAHWFAESGLNPKNLQNNFEKRLGYTDESYTKAIPVKFLTEDFIGKTALRFCRRYDISACIHAAVSKHHAYNLRELDCARPSLDEFLPGLLSDDYIFIFLCTHSTASFLYIELRLLAPFSDKAPSRNQ